MRLQIIYCINDSMSHCCHGDMWATHYQTDVSLFLSEGLCIKWSQHKISAENGCCKGWRCFRWWMGMDDCGGLFHGPVPVLWIPPVRRGVVPQVAQCLPGGKRHDGLGRIHGVWCGAHHQWVLIISLSYVCVCVCVCVREREREFAGFLIKSSLCKQQEFWCCYVRHIITHADK